MATVQVRDARGEVLEERELPQDLFGRPINVSLMHQVVVAGAAAQRAGTHATKTRGEVRGGGVKPWRQKGTGRARQGSIRAPHWTGGGVAHGPKPRDYSMRVNRKMKQAALRSALSDALTSGKLAVVNDLAFDGPKTKDAVGVLEALELAGKVLLVLGQPDEAVEKSFRNLTRVKVDYPRNLSTYDVLDADRILFTSAALDALTGEVSEPSIHGDDAGPEVPPPDDEVGDSDQEAPAESEASGDQDEDERAGEES
jgi:large subunit ribosomal protein L4